MSAAGGAGCSSSRCRRPPPWGSAAWSLLLALALPAFRETADDDWLKKSELAVTFLDRYGNEIGSRGIKHNDSIPLEDFPDALIKATLATEDRRFYEHFGIDFAGTARALITNAQAGGVRQGGSSITQQLAKNLFLTNERTIERKINEAFLAIWLETRLTKNEILKLYLDRAYMGGGTFGVDGAAHFYFNKSVRDVNLAGSRDARRPVQGADQIRAAHQPARRARPRQRRARQPGRRRLHDRGPGVRRAAQSRLRRRPPRRELAELLPRLRLRRDAQARRHLPEIDAPSACSWCAPRSTLNVQHAADDAVENQLRQYGRDYHASQAATVVADLDGGVRAMVGGRDYGASQFNRATDALSPARLLVQALCLRHRAR